MATASMPTHAYVPTTGDSTHAEQDVRRILQCLVSCLRALPAPLLTRVVRIGVAGQMHGVLLWRGDGSASHLITWEDRRVTPEFIEDLARDHPDLSGSLLALRSGYGCATLAHLATQSPDVLSGYEHCGSVMDFVVCTLCGVQDVKPVMEPTTAQRSVCVCVSCAFVCVRGSLLFPSHASPVRLESRTKCDLLTSCACSPALCTWCCVCVCVQLGPV